jgi:glycosyltransferase involved in cell wall biosynthesis
MKGEIVINGRFLTRKITGVERYGREVLDLMGDQVRVVEPNRAYTGAWGHVWEQAALPRKLAPNDVLWSPANTGPLSVRRQVLTIQDISFIEHPEWFRRGFAVWYQYLISRLVKQVEYILTPSSYSHIRIRSTFRISDQKIAVIPGGVNPNRFYPRTNDEINEVRRQYDLRAPFVLFVGSLEPRKNLERLLRAWGMIPSRVNELELVIAGTHGSTFGHIRLSEIPRSVRFLGYVAESDLPALYSAAMAFIQPALYEGFGLTALEAMACATPVIVSKSTALEEVVGEAGTLIDPLDEEDIADALCRLMDDTVLRQKYITAGLERSMSYSWDRAAKHTLEILEKVRRS